MRLSIPSSFRREPFFKDETYDVEALSADFVHNLKSQPFIYDLTEAGKPWLERETYMPLVFECWKEQEQQVAYLFRERKAEKTPMIHMIALFISGLFWVNRCPVQSLIDVEKRAGQLRLHPINIEERLGFLLTGPMRYHSFVQLKALMTELEKMYVRDVAMEKHKKNSKSD